MQPLKNMAVKTAQNSKHLIRNPTQLLKLFSHIGLKTSNDPEITHTNFTQRGLLSRSSPAVPQLTSFHQPYIFVLALQFSIFKVLF